MAKYISTSSLIKLSVLLLILVLIVYHNEILSYMSSYEGFEDIVQSGTESPGLIYNTSKVKYEYDAQEPNKFPETIFERSADSIFGATPVMVCNLIPTRKSRDCLINNEPIVKYKFPVHLLMLANGKHLAVFNDGRLYMKNKLTDKMWQGPLKNSLPNRDVPLRMVTMNPAGTKLVAVGYDNNAYIKYGDENQVLDLESEWRPLVGLENIIYLMYRYDEATDSNRYIVIDTDGKIKISQTDKPDSGLVDYGVLREPILKLCYSADGYMLAIDSKFQLRTFEDKEWATSKFSTKFGSNPSRVIDVLYDKDQLLFGAVFIPRMGVVEIMKQEEPDFQAKFVPFELNKYLTGGMETRLTDRGIIYTKLGIYTNQGMLEEEALDDDINMAYQRQMLLDKARLRTFCAGRGIKTDETYRNYEVLRQVEDNKRKIDKLNGIITELISFDPDQKSIQESIIGVNFVQDQINKQGNAQ
jgi:hypothetical protein